MIESRIKELLHVRAGDLVPHESNWRKHPKRQRDALKSMLGKIGYADALIARKDPDGKLHLIDGHLRASIDPKQVVPVLVTDLSPEEAKLLLATLDPIAAMAESDAAVFDGLVEDVGPLLDSDEDAGLAAFLSDLQEDLGDMAEKQLPYEKPKAEYAEPDDDPDDPASTPGAPVSYADEVQAFTIHVPNDEWDTFTEQLESLTGADENMFTAAWRILSLAVAEGAAAQ